MLARCADSGRDTTRIGCALAGQGAKNPQPRRFSFIKLQRIRVADSFVDDMAGIEIAYVLS